MYKTQIETVLTLDAHARHCFAGCFAIDELASLKPPPPPPPQATLPRTTTTTTAAMTNGQLQKRQHRRRRQRRQRRPQQYDEFQARKSSRSSGSSQGRAYVINYDESNEPGSHWVVVYDSSSSSSSSSPEFFDPAGLPPLDDRIKAYLLGPDYTYNPNCLQQVQGNACGFYCVYYILQRSRNVSADDIVEFLASLSSSSSSSSGAGSSQGDFFVKDFIYSQFKPVFN